MATSGAYYNTAFNFTYAIAKASDPTVFFTSTFVAGEVKVSKRSGSGAITTANIASLPVPNSSGLMNISLSASEMQADEITIEFIPSSGDFGARAVSITTEPTPGDVLEVQKSAVSGVADFKATGFSTFDPASDTVASVTTVGSVSGAVGSVTAAVTTDSASRTASQADVSSLATASALTSVDTEVGQIKAKTDQLTFTVSNQVDANALTGGGDATSANQTTIIGHLNDVKGTGWVAADNLAEIAEDVTGLNGAAMRGTDSAYTGTPPTAAAIYSEFTSGSNENAFKADVSALATASALATVDGNVDAILVDTATTIPATLTTMTGKIDTIDGIVDSILADTGTDGVALSTATLQSIADEILKRDVDNVESTANEHTLATIILCLLESSRSSTTWTIKRSDGVTTHATKTLTLDDDAQPVVGVD